MSQNKDKELKDGPVTTLNNQEPRETTTFSEDQHQLKLLLSQVLLQMLMRPRF